MHSPQQYSQANQLQSSDFNFTLRKFSSLLTWPDDCDVLDVGCGSGNVTRDVLLPSLRKCGRLIGVDVSPAMVDFANSNFKMDVAPCKLEFQVMDIANVQLPWSLHPGGFHQVFSNYCLHWIHERSAFKTALKNIFDLLKPTGELLFLMMAKRNISSAFLSLAAKPEYAPHMKDTARHVSPYENSEHPDSECREDLESVGYIVKSCKVLFNSFTFQSYNEARALEQGVKPFHLTMSHELCERYLDDLTEELPYVKNEDGSYTWKYTALEVFATKP